MPNPFDRFTTQARRILTQALEEALRLNHNYVGTEHLLLALLSEGLTTGVLENLGFQAAMLRSSFEGMIARGTETVVGEIGLSERAKRVVELATQEANFLLHQEIDAVHLLIGIVLERDGIAARFLENQGVNLDRLRGQIAPLFPRTREHAAADEPALTYQEVSTAFDMFEALEPQFVVGTLLISFAPEFWAKVQEDEKLVRRLAHALANNLLRQ